MDSFQIEYTDIQKKLFLKWNCARYQYTVKQCFDVELTGDKYESRNDGGK